MKQPVSIHDVRRLTIEALRRLGVSIDDPINETILVSGGLYCGRRFEVSGWQATWRADRDEVTIVDPQGNTALILNVNDQAVPLRAAA